MTVIVTFLEEF